MLQFELQDWWNQIYLTKALPWDGVKSITLTCNLLSPSLPECVLSSCLSPECLLSSWQYSIFLAVFCFIGCLLYSWMSSVYLTVFYIPDSLLFPWLSSIFLTVFYLLAVSCTPDCLLSSTLSSTFLTVFFLLDCLVSSWHCPVFLQGDMERQREAAVFLTVHDVGSNYQVATKDRNNKKRHNSTPVH